MNSTELTQASNRVGCVNKGSVVKNADGPRNFNLLADQPLENAASQRKFYSIHGTFIPIRYS
jgi:hypothetical protein